jgi:uncharacterized protein with HEPN domain
LKDDWVYIRHILDEIEYLQSVRPLLTYDLLTTNITTEHSITRALEIIGEATKNVPDRIKKQYPDVPWREMAGLRDRIIHGYFQIDYTIVWRVITEDLPVIEPKIRAIYDQVKK